MNNPTAGEREGDGSDGPGSEIEQAKAGEDEAPSEQETRRMRRGAERDNPGPALGQDQYASPLGGDMGDSGGEGAKDRLAQKEGPGEHKGISGKTGAGGKADDGGKAAVDAFLENIGEERGMYLKYREIKGKQQLRSEGRAAPEKDW
jgi:hypothetical protein